VQNQPRQIVDHRQRSLPGVQYHPPVRGHRDDCRATDGYEPCNPWKDRTAPTTKMAVAR
jgi:hypothetical protein